MNSAMEWSATKSAELKDRYGFGFERVVVAIAEGAVLDIRAHPNKQKYPHQNQLIVKIERYAWVVPFVTDESRIFLKTFFPSRTATKDLGG